MITPTEALQNHLSLCDEVHQLALEENRFLKQHQRPPDDALLTRKRALLVRLDESLTALKSNPTAPNQSENPNLKSQISDFKSQTPNLRSPPQISDLKSQISNPPPPPSRPDPARKEIIEKARAKILQILHLDRENEQLLLRHSLGARPATPATPPPPASQIQRLYDRHS